MHKSETVRIRSIQDLRISSTGQASKQGKTSACRRRAAKPPRQQVGGGRVGHGMCSAVPRWMLGQLRLITRYAAAVLMNSVVPFELSTDRVLFYRTHHRYRYELINKKRTVQGLGNPSAYKLLSEDTSRTER